MAPDASMAAEHYGLGSKAILAKIDKLFECGVGELVNLPQIIVVGDQSSGKSSVLEGLIKMPLPRDSGLCTRFATQIVFRRTAQAKTSVSIIPEKNASPERRSRLRAFAKIVPSLDSEAFVEIMEEVHDIMGVSKKHKSSETDNALETQKPTFSNDMLRLEISGPGQEHFSVIDIPGIFRDATEGLTTTDDIQMVRSMVKSYMANPRSVILAVIPANVDVATQEILSMAHEFDPRQDRTLGVLTKPDLVDEGAEPTVMQLLENRVRRMKLGWHIIRNPGQKELSEKDMHRDHREMTFFRDKAPWKDLRKDLVGIEALRHRLNEVLSLVVKNEFPSVKAEIKSRLADCQNRLDDLGPERGSQPEQLAFLNDLATRFQRLVSFALIANHGADDIFDAELALRMSPAVMTRMQIFSDEVAKYGHTYSFLPSSDDEEALPSNDQIGESAANFLVRKEDDLDELTDILQPQVEHLQAVASGIKEWLSDVFAGNRGFEMGTFNASILATVMKKQSAKWGDISKGFVSDIIVIVHRFITAALQSLCTDGEICRALLDAIFDDLVERYQRAIENTRFLLKVENTNTPMTLNHYFNETLQKSRHGKVVGGLEKSAFHNGSHGMVVRLEQAINTSAMSNDNHVILEIHDILKSYYKVTRKTFVDSVCKQAVMHYLLSADGGPLALFSPSFVSQLSSTQLDEIAGEAPAVKRLRDQLLKEIDSLTEATKILARP